MRTQPKRDLLWEISRAMKLTKDNPNLVSTYTSINDKRSLTKTKYRIDKQHISKSICIWVCMCVHASTMFGGIFKGECLRISIELISTFRCG